MIVFKRQQPVQQEIVADSISYIITHGKLRVSNKNAVISVLSRWAENTSLWKWKAKENGKGVGGYPLALVRGIRYIDNLLLGKMFSYPLYEKYTDKKWTVRDITYSIEQLNIAATDNTYFPSDPERKKALCRLSLDKFFWNGVLKGEPVPYTHAPFLFFYETGAVLNEDMLPRKAPESRYLFDAILSLYFQENGLSVSPMASNRDHNKVVRMADNLFSWWNSNKEKVAPVNRNIDLIIHVTRNFFATWKKPIQLYSFVSLRAETGIIEELSKYTNYVEMTVEKSTETVAENELLPTSILEAVSDGDYAKTLCLYALKNNVSIPINSIDSYKLACFSNLALRQLLRKWKLGELSTNKPVANSLSWKDILEKG